MLQFESLNPVHNPRYIGINIVVRLAFQLDYDLLIVCFARFLEEDLEDLGVNVLLKFECAIIPREKASQYQSMRSGVDMGLAPQSN